MERAAQVDELDEHNITPLCLDQKRMGHPMVWRTNWTSETFCMTCFSIWKLWVEKHWRYWSNFFVLTLEISNAGLHFWATLGQKRGRDCSINQMDGFQQLLFFTWCLVPFFISWVFQVLKINYTWTLKRDKKKCSYNFCSFHFFFCSFQFSKKKSKQIFVCFFHGPKLCSPHELCGSQVARVSEQSHRGRAQTAGSTGVSSV